MLFVLPGLRLNILETEKMLQFGADRVIASRNADTRTENVMAVVNCDDYSPTMARSVDATFVDSGV